MPNENIDVIVVGAGNAAFCAALAAQEQGAKVVMCEAAPEDESGGNSRFTAGSIRVVYNGVDPGLFTPGDIPTSGTPMVLSVGNLIPTKGHALLIRAAAALAGGSAPGGRNRRAR